MNARELTLVAVYAHFPAPWPREPSEAGHRLSRWLVHSTRVGGPEMQEEPFERRRKYDQPWFINVGVGASLTPDASDRTYTGK